MDILNYIPSRTGLIDSHNRIRATDLDTVRENQSVIYIYIFGWLNVGESNELEQRFIMAFFFFNFIELLSFLYLMTFW